MNNIYLIGMMGSGKSVVAQLLAGRLTRKMEDLDERIVAHEGKSINDIFADEGEPYFRSVEKKILKTVAALTERVVSTGGGIVLDEENMHCMRKTGTIIYLKAPTDVLYERVKDKSDRPLLKGESPKDKLDRIYNHRAGLYARADYAIETEHVIPHDIAEEIIQLLKAKGSL